MVRLLHAFEQAQDQAYALGGELAAALVAAQGEQRLAPGVGQSAFMAFSQAMLHLSTARGHAVDGHKALEKVGRLFRIEVADEGDRYGDERKYPDPRGASAADGAHLSVAA